ncbi:hypothetical protein [Sediminibacterium soli]|uniref:hypothetical protein n=1 Tax=Sediminibacterium soli TaxID=2698829 RepID=UPI00137AB428|nr:hypothetical protein [Sediminibacterium soli]NCI48281.1 hypothetical protein [Sediminibacterium soli]
MKYLLFASLLFCRAAAFSQQPAPFAGPEKNDTASLHLLYGIISHKNPPLTGEARWPHRDMLYKALGLNQSMGDSAIAGAMQIGWQQLAAVRISDKNEPTVYFRDLLRIALHERFGPLLLDAVRWGVDLNTMDMVEHKTLLDWLEYEYRENADTRHAEWLREYKQILQGGGAVYFTELDFHMKRLAKKNEKIRPPVFGLYAVRRKGRWGWVNKYNTPVIPLKYAAVRYTNGKFFEVSSSGNVFTWIKRN